MPWDQQEYDLKWYVCICRGNLLLALMVLLRSLNGVWSLTHESLTTNIESREWRRRELENAGVHCEHPRASTTDDVECFFSVMSDIHGGKTLHCKRSSAWVEQRVWQASGPWTAFSLSHIVSWLVLWRFLSRFWLNPTFPYLETESLTAKDPP